jgi:glycosyltransferase involved in cell wall biosynthesis
VQRRRVYWRVYPPFERRLFDLSDAFIVHSEAQRRRLPARKRVAIIEFGIEPCACGTQPVGGTPTVGCFGLIAPFKGIETVIEACAQAAERLPGLRLVIAGAVANPRAPAYARELSSVARARLGDRVEIVLNAPEPEFDRLMHSVDLACFGFRHSNQSGTFYRALGHGRPIVTTDAGATAEVVRREGLGRVVPVDDADAMAGAIEELLGDRRCLEQTRAAVEGYARRRSWQANAAEHAALYRSLLAPATGQAALPDRRAA